MLVLITPALNGVIFRDMAFKGPVLYVCLWEFDREYLKNNANKGQQGISIFKFSCRYSSMSKS